MTAISVLIVDDDKDILVQMKKVLEGVHFKDIYCARATEEMLNILKSERIDVVLLDNHLGAGIQGSDFIAKIKEINSDIEVIMITSDRSLELIIKAIKNGAFYFLPKDNFDPIELVTLISKAASFKRVKEEHKALSEAYTLLQENELSFEVIGNSKNLSDMRAKLSKLARSKMTNCLLFEGEEGTGKNEMAKYYYSLLKSTDRFRPFFRVKCANLDRAKFKSLFFGDDEDPKKKGILEISNSSVILFEGISNLNSELQDDVLSLIKQRQIALNISGQVTKRDNKLMIIATSDVDLKSLANAGKFSKDLFYEISAISFTLSPLRERKDDLINLIEHFGNEISKAQNTSFPKLPQIILDILLNYNWPGNISELKSALEKLYILGFEDGEFNLNELPHELLTGQYDFKGTGCKADENLALTISEIIEGQRSYAEKLVMFRRLLIEKTLKKNNFVVAHAAKELQKNRSSFYRELSDLQIEIPS